MAQVSARLSDNAHRGWHLFATVNGVSVTAVMEALGLSFLEREGQASDVGPARDIVAHARTIDAQRRFQRSNGGDDAEG